MIQVRRSRERGHFDYGWLDTRHTFSFGRYHDPRHVGFRALRVINEDWVQPRSGFPTHPHQDMEILTYVVEGALEHRDSTGTGSVIRPGEVQKMSAGTGITHSEVNPSRSEPVHFLQIWILPERDGLEPGYEQRAFPPAERTGRLRLLASRDGREGSIRVHQDVALWGTILEAGQTVRHDPARGRHLWVQVVRGRVALGEDLVLEEGDGAAISGEERVVLRAPQGAEVLLFDLA